ncbi:uncharacterized protein LOC128998409 [Macrosteles quadrilineatus]|uniref:uncharacterized protein LOC128998409 n=1 Tax=Macrosteles quadrilineatus TaxID=74068 RepID=UPI0023E1824C|nr:uncharacterized protein LOC128998409 [Macrosteles quadrilineatus]
MLARVVSVCVLVVSVLHISGTCGETNITLLTLPINLTSWRTSLHRTFNGSLVRPLTSHLSSALNDTLQFFKTGSVGCTPEGEECIPDVPSCCPSTADGHLGDREDEDLQCLPQGGVYRCSLVTDSEDVAQLRLNALEYGDSAGQLESHPWINSWEFQSRSMAEREELQALQDAEWKKNWKPSSQENVWIKAYNKVKNEALNAWKDLRKMKKLKEVKDTLIDKKNKRLEPTVPPAPEPVQEPLPEPEDEPVVEEEEKEENPATQKAARVLYPDELSEETIHGNKGQAESGSEESVIKFSDELPKRDKKLDFRLDNLIKDAMYLASEKLKKTTEQGNRPSGKDSSVVSPLSSQEELLRLENIQDIVDKLTKEVNDLKSLKTQRDENNKDNVDNKGPSIDELIEKHVRNILEEKRRLYELRQIEEARRLKKEGLIKT